jgi:hypothetical protein
MFMRRLLLASLALFAFCGNALAWGDMGHTVVCEIAFRLAAPDTRAAIRKLIRDDPQFDSFGESCTFPDHPHKRPSEHFINLPRDSKGLTSEECPQADKCLLTAIANDSGVLSSNARPKDKLIALKFLGHWVGDIHQPLHVSFEDDRGGNTITVSGECTGKLHSTWDTCLVEKAVGSDASEAATDLINAITPAMKERWTAVDDPRDWANESFAIAEAAKTKYCTMRAGSCEAPASQNVVIDSAYVETNMPIVRERLQRAGVRLARLLDKLFGE